MTQIPVNLYPEIFPRLNIADIDVVEGAAGPGRRLVVWLQGCLKRCSGCANAAFLIEKTNRVLSVEHLLKVLDETEVSGVTLSGGEPVAQAKALLPFLRAVGNRGLSVVCYSGYTLEELRREDNDPALAEFLNRIDLLIDGEYERDLPRAGPYRSSSNQRLHFLSGRISEDECAENTETVFRITGSRAIATGTLPFDIRRQLFEKLRARGITLTPD
ncbi:MAG: 4Fe-4S single cluster domain-containing protein [Acidobacteriota bacterium]